PEWHFIGCCCDAVILIQLLFMPQPGFFTPSTQVWFTFYCGEWFTRISPLLWVRPCLHASRSLAISIGILEQSLKLLRACCFLLHSRYTHQGVTPFGESFSLRCFSSWP